MPNYTSQNRLNQKFGVKGYSDDRTSLEVVGRVGINTIDAVQSLDVRGGAYISNDVGIGTTDAVESLDVRGGAYISNDVGIGQTTFDSANESNTSILAVGIVTANFYYGDGSNLTGIDDVGLANSLSRNGQGQLLYQSGNEETSLLQQGSLSQVLTSRGAGQPPQWTNAAPAGAVEGFLIYDEGTQLPVGVGTTFGALNFVGAAVTVEGSIFGGIATVTVNQEFAKVAGFASDSKVAGIASDAERVRLSDLSDDVQVFIPFSTEATGVTTINTNQNLSFNPSSGLLTATKFAGIGSDITDLNASELKSGTIPDTVFPDNLPSKVIVGFAATAGIATTAVSAGVANTANILNLEAEDSDTENFITFATEATGDQRLKTNNSLKFNAADGNLSASKFSGDGSGLTNLNEALGPISFASSAGIATTAKELETNRSIFGNTFNGTQDVSGTISSVTSITGENQDLIIQPKDDQSTVYNLILRGNNVSDGEGGGVKIGDKGRGSIEFFSAKNNDAYKFYKPDDDSIYASLDFNQLTNSETFTFPNKTGTIALLDDISNGTAQEALTLRSFERTDDLDFQLIFINEGATGLGTTVFSNSQIKYNPGQDVLTAGEFSGIGSQLSELDASKIDRGVIGAEYLPIAYRKTSSLTIDADGDGNDLDLQAGDHITLSSGQDEGGGSIKFEGNNGENSYSFKKGGASEIAIISFQDITTNVTYKLPEKTGVANTFAMLDDITEGTAGVAKTAENLKIVNSDEGGTTNYLILSSVLGDNESQPIVDDELFYNPNSNKLTAGEFAGSGIGLTNLKANELRSGTIDKDRLPNVYRKFQNITIDAATEGDSDLYRDLTLQATKGIDIKAGLGTTGGLTFRGNLGDESYAFRRVKDNGNRTIFLSFDDITLNNKIFKLPNKNATGVSTFAMLEDLTGDGDGVGVVVSSAKKFNDNTIINFTNNVEGRLVFNGGEENEIGVAITVSNATSAGVATDVDINNDDGGTRADTYITFVDGGGSGKKRLITDNSIRFNQHTSTLIVENLTGTATTASNVKLINTGADPAVTQEVNIIIGSNTNDGNQQLRRNGNLKFDTQSNTVNSTNFNATGIITAADFNSTSDIKLKTNIERISDPIEKVLQIDGVSFNWIGNGKPSLGVIADNVQEILPEIVTDGDPKTVNYNGLIGLLIEAVKEQQNEINSLKERLSKLE